MTREISPRDYVQRASEFVDGTFVNSYAAHHGLEEAAPAAPWAMWLTERPYWFRFVCFDFDTKHGRAWYDAGRLSLWLDELGIEHTITESGPTGGRHVWIALSERVHGTVVHRIGRLAKQLLPSLDPSALSEAGGAVRPPGAPHRVSGVSRPQGSVLPLQEPSTTADDLTALDALLVDLGAEVGPPADTSQPHNVQIDAAGHPYLVGARRELSARTSALLQGAPDGDTSAIAASILAGCANARWHHADVVDLVDHSPGLEHIRSRRAGSRRVRRTSRERARVLKSVWASAVTFVAANPAAGEHDPTFPGRVADVVATVERVQARANLTPGLWAGNRATAVAGRGSLVFRAVLDALCVYMLQAAATEVEADTRRLSEDTGWDASHVGTILHTLADDTDGAAWIQFAGDRVDAAHGQRFRLHPKFSTDPSKQNPAQVLARLAGASPLTHRALLLDELHGRLSPLRTDAFAAPRSLGRTAGHVYRALSTAEGANVESLTEQTGLPRGRVVSYLRRLASHGLARRRTNGWIRTALSLTRVADAVGVSGYLRARVERHRAERARWMLWLDDVRWRRERGKHKRGRRLFDQLTLAGLERHTRVRYPRGPGGRGQHAHVLSALLALQDTRPGVRFH